MSGQGIAGLVLLNTVLFLVGASVLWSLRGFPTWGDVLRLSGLAYLLGVSSLGPMLVFELTVGIPVGLISVLVSSVLLCAGALVAGFALGRARPSGRPTMRLSLPTAVFAAVIVVYFEALFRAGRLGGLYEWDGWAFWVPKAKAIYYFGALDERFFGELPGQTYPPLVPALQAVAFHFMGSADQVTLHLQFWFFYLGFVGAVIGLLCTRVRPLLLWPFVLLMLCSPNLSGGELTAQGDFLLDELLIAAALLIGLWLLERERWQLYAATLLLGAAFLTKREGYLIAFCLIAAALVASRLEGRRGGWRPLLLTAAAAFAVSIPWLVWFRAHGFGGGGPSAGGFGLLDNLDRAWPSFWLAVSAFFDFHLFLATGELALVAILLAFVAGKRTLPAYVGLSLVLGIAGFTWITWSFPELPIDKESPLNPITRVTMSIVMMAAVFTPLLLQAAWDASARDASARRRGTNPAVRRAMNNNSRQTLVVWSVLVVVVLAYPVGVLAGGLPRFPSVSDCVRRATADGNLEVVFGHFDSYDAAVRARDEALRYGFKGTGIALDGCLRLKVALPGVPTIEVGREVIAEAHSVGLEPTLEHSG